MNPRTLTSLLPLALELKDHASTKAEAYHRARLEGEILKASNAEIRKATRQERGVLPSLLTSTNSQRNEQLARTRALPVSEVKGRISAGEASIIDQVLTWLY